MAGFNEFASSTNASDPNASLLPIEWSREVIKEVEQSSVLMALSQTRRLSTRTWRAPATSVLANAYFVSGEPAPSPGDPATSDASSLKQTTRNLWAPVTLVVEEIACLVPVPNAYMADNSFPVWEETRPSVVEAIAQRVDAAALFQIGLPSTWNGGVGLYQAIQAAGNVSDVGDADDLAQAVAYSARDLKRGSGFNSNGFGAQPGLQWELVGARSADGVPIYQTNLAGPISTGLYGRPLVESGFAEWPDELKLIHGAWRHSLVGIREDVSFSKHEDGVITDADGVVTFNAMQQDSTIWRAVIRLAWAVANPATRRQPTAASRYPFAAITEDVS